MSVIPLTAVLAVLASASAGAQPPPIELFVTPPAAPSVAREQGAVNDRAVLARQTVGIRLDLLFGVDANPAPRVQLTVDGTRWIARMERLDHDAADFRSWVGAIEGIDYSHVVFTERNGVVSGLINAVGRTYRIQTTGGGTYQLERIDPGQLGDELDPLMRLDGAPPPLERGTVVQTVQDTAVVVDVLLLYTPNARAAAGGTAQVQAMASQVISDSNTIYIRSAIRARVRLLATAEFALNETNSMANDLTALTDSAAAQSLRDAAGADLVQLLVNSPDLSTCGIAWLLNSLASADFDGYSVADISCLAQYTPTHEMGHNMGAHHAPEDGASGALFSYSYGFKDPSRGFRTVMAYACGGSPECPRVANVSNPAVSHNSGATGTDTQNNALTIDNTATIVAGWRQSSPNVPPPPTGLRSHAAGTAVTLTWEAPPGPPPLSYTLQVGSASGGSDLFNRIVGNTNLVSGTIGPGTYFWRVIANYGPAASAPSVESQVTVGSTCVAPAAPTNFNFSLSARVVTLSWSPPVAGGAPDVYIIDAGSAPGLADLFSGSTGNAVPVVVVEAPPGSYFVRIRAQNACGLSGPSNERLIVVP